MPTDRAIGRRRRRVEIRQCHRRLDRRQRGAQLRDLVASIDGAVAVAVAVDHEQHLRLDLSESIDDRADTELRCARRPHGTEARGRQHRDQPPRGCSVDKRRRGHPARRRAGANRPGHAPLVPAARAYVSSIELARLRTGHDGDTVERRPQHVTRVVHRSVREPVRGGHRADARPVLRAEAARSRRTPRRSARTGRGQWSTTATDRRTSSKRRSKRRSSSSR